MDYLFDAVIIGGGASGLMCAATAKAASPKLKIAVIEKNDRVGKKLMSTGNGRCNLSNLDLSPKKYTGSFGKGVSYALKKYDTAYLRGVFKDMGLLTYADSEGRIYPRSKQASSVLDVLRFRCESPGVGIFCSQQIRSVKKQNGMFLINTETDRFKAPKLIMASGSKAAPKLGGSAGGADILKNLGHRLISYSPALCPLSVSDPVLKSLSGIRAQGTATLLRNGVPVRSESGEIQFTNDALSGICIFNLSVYAEKGDVISLDLLSDISENELLSILHKQKQLFASQKTDCLFTGIFVKRLGQAILQRSGAGDFSRECRTLESSQLKSICKNTKALRFTVSGFPGFDKAQCCKGGVFGSEIEPETMKSRVCKGLSVCGEAIDVCGECGGYNLHFAFVSGIIAGENL